MQNFLIIGATGSIGSKVKELLIKNGCAVITASSRKGQGDLHLNYNDPASMEALAAFSTPLNGIIFASGIEPQKSLAESDPGHQSAMLNIHVTGPLNTVKHLQKNLKEGSSLVFISSVAAKKGSYDPMYAIAKGAVEAMTRTLAVELSKNKIRVNCIAPSLVENSPVFNRMTEDFRERHRNNTLNKTLISATDCAEAILFLVNQKAITGQVLHVNGGQYFGS